MRIILTAVALSVLMSAGISGQQITGIDAQRYVNADRGLSIDQLVAMALERSPVVLAARARIEAARGERVQSALRPNPSLMSDWREEVGGADRVSMLGLNVPLDLFQRRGRIGVADQAIVIAEQEAAEIERGLGAGVRSKALQVLAAVRQLGLRVEIAATLTQFRDLVGARAASGAAPPLERDMAEVEGRRADAEVSRQRAAAAAALAELRGWIGMPTDQPLLLRSGLEDIERSWATADPSESGATIAQVLNTRPDVRVAEAQLASSSARANLVRLEAKPEVSLSGSYMRMNSGFALFGVDASGAQVPIRSIFHNLSIGATVTLPWRDRRQGDIAAASARTRAAQHEVNARRIAASAEIDAARVRVRHLEEALAIYANGLRTLALRNLEVVRQSYALGRATLLDVLNATRRYLDVETAYTDVLVDTLQARIDLASAMGGIR